MSSSGSIIQQPPERLYTAIRNQGKCAFSTFLGSGPRRPEIRPTVRMLVEGHISFFLKRAPTLTGVSSIKSRSSASVDGRRDITNLF